jgi:hypothetical protein
MSAKNPASRRAPGKPTVRQRGSSLRGLIPATAADRRIIGAASSRRPAPTAAATMTGSIETDIGDQHSRIAYRDRVGAPDLQTSGAQLAICGPVETLPPPARRRDGHNRRSGAFAILENPCRKRVGMNSHDRTKMRRYQAHAAKARHEADATTDDVARQQLVERAGKYQRTASDLRKHERARSRPRADE